MFIANAEYKLAAVSGPSVAASRVLAFPGIGSLANMTMALTISISKVGSHHKFWFRSSMFVKIS